MKASDNKKSFKVPRPNTNVSASSKWTVFVVFLSFILSVVFSFVTSAAMEKLSVTAAFVVLFLIIGTNVLFDIIGTAVMAAEEAPFHSLSARKVKGAKESIRLIRHAPQLTNLCCDVIGDIAGIISGAATAAIVTELVFAFGWNSILPSLILSGLVGSLTIGGKAVCKGIAMRNGNSIVFSIGKAAAFFKHTR